MRRLKLKVDENGLFLRPLYGYNSVSICTLKPKEEQASITSASTQRMYERIYCALSTLHLQGKAGEEPLSQAAYVPFYLNQVKDQQEKQVTHTYHLIEAKIFMEATK